MVAKSTNTLTLILAQQNKRLKGIIASKLRGLGVCLHLNVSPARLASDEWGDNHFDIDSRTTGSKCKSLCITSNCIGSVCSHSSKSSEAQFEGGQLWRKQCHQCTCKQPAQIWTLGSFLVALLCENTRAAWQLFFTARTWAKPHRFDSSVTLLLRRVVQSKTQWHSNVLKLLKLLQKSSQASKTFFQFLQIKRLQLKLTNNLQNSYQISSKHQVPKTWVKQHPKTPKTTKTNENPSPSSSMHKLVPFGSKLVPTWFL